MFCASIFYASLFFLRLCIALQPFGRALVKASNAFFGMEQEKSALRGLLEIEAGELFRPAWPVLFVSCASALIVFPSCCVTFL